MGNMVLMLQVRDFHKSYIIILLDALMEITHNNNKLLLKLKFCIFAIFKDNCKKFKMFVLNCS